MPLVAASEQRDLAPKIPSYFAIPRELFGEYLRGFIKFFEDGKIALKETKTNNNKRKSID